MDYLENPNYLIRCQQEIFKPTSMQCTQTVSVMCSGSTQALEMCAVSDYFINFYVKD